MICDRCGNQSMEKFVKVNGTFLCRKCIMFKLVDDVEVIDNDSLDAEYQLDFKLSSYQKSVSCDVLKILKKSDCLLYAACGTGKTEIILQSIQYFLENNMNVIFAIPRRQVVLELAKRLSRYFSKLKVTAVCQGYTSDCQGDLIVCTTHQLYRYKNFADLLVIDEPDAFPFKDNTMLQYFAKKACRGNTVYLTATPTKKLLELPTVNLFKRFHGVPLLVPSHIVGFKLFLWFQAVKFLKTHKRTLFFVPSKQIAKRLGKLLHLPYITSECLSISETMESFRNGDFDILICTTILERGVTFSNVNILVLYADHPSYDLASLIQIAGRVGRDPKYPRGHGLFLSRKKSRKVDECLARLRMMNA